MSALTVTEAARRAGLKVGTLLVTALAFVAAGSTTVAAVAAGWWQARRARHALAFLLSPRPPEPVNIPFGNVRYRSMS